LERTGVKGIGPYQANVAQFIGDVYNTKRLCAPY
jgi:hypothetical protein